MNSIEGIIMGLLIMFNSFCWLTNNILLGSIADTLMELTFSSINLITGWRMHKALPPTPLPQ
ncbi:MAG: YgjV family protein [Shewanella sp.]|nr:YgjV family protein [Shewanella sp.]MCF1432182.1 YgjV family protein [Shewanella sp.]MCF1439768.1 YgjV family protein [Shewanella sp.]MCF1456921.1 YgjV family protein [Shewanella sp.]